MKTSTRHYMNYTQRWSPTTAAEVNPLRCVAAIQRDDGLPVTAVSFADFGLGVEAVVSRNTGGWIRLLLGDRPLEDKVIQECFDGTVQDAVGPSDATASAANKRLWIAHGRLRSAVRLSDHARMVDEDYLDFNVTGESIVSEEPFGLALDEANNLLYTVTKQGGVYMEDVSTPSTPVLVDSISLASYLGTGEYLVDVQVHTTPGELLVAVLSTKRLFTISPQGGVLTLKGQTEAISTTTAHATFSDVELVLWNRMVLGKNATGDVVAYVIAQCTGYESATPTRPFAQVLVACDLNKSGSYVSPTFLPATPRLYNPFPVAPSGWAAYLVSNPDAAKEDFSVWDCALTSNGGTNYLYVCHGRMNQVKRLTVTDVLGAGFTVSSLIQCHPNYTADPATNTAPRIQNIAVHPSNFEKFIIFEYETGVRTIVLNAGAVTVATRNAHASLQINKGALHDIPMMLMSGGLVVAWHMDTYQTKHVKRGVDISTATPVASFEHGWTFAMDGISAVAENDSIYTLTFGGVIPYQSAGGGADFDPVFSGYQPAFGNDGVHADRHSNTEQVLTIKDLTAPGSVHIASCCGEGGFMFYDTDAFGLPQPPTFVPQPAEYAAIASGPLNGWTSAAGGPGTYYSNMIVYAEVGGQKYILQDITNRELSKWAILAWRWNGSAWVYVTGQQVSTGFSAYSSPLSSFLHVPSQNGKFCYVGVQKYGTVEGGYLIGFDISALTSSNTITAIATYDLTATINSVAGIASSKDRLFVVGTKAIGTSPEFGYLEILPYNLATGAVSTGAAVESVNLGGLAGVPSISTEQPWFCGFYQDDATSGSGTLIVGTSGGTILEFYYDPQSSGYFTQWLTPPTPSPATFSSAPAQNGVGSVTMTATAAVYSGPVEYRFFCHERPQLTSAWQSSRTYAPTGITSGLSLTFSCQSRNQSHGTTQPSAVSSPVVVL